MRVLIAERGDGLVTAYLKARVGTSEHRVVFGCEAALIKLRRKGNGKTPFLVFEPPSAGADFRVRAGEKQGFLGEEIEVRSDPTYRIRLHGTAPFSRVVFIHDDEIVQELKPGTAEVDASWTDTELAPGQTSWTYVRGEQEDGGADGAGGGRHGALASGPLGSHHQKPEVMRVKFAGEDRQP